MICPLELLFVQHVLKSGSDCSPAVSWSLQFLSILCYYQFIFPWNSYILHLKFAFHSSLFLNSELLLTTFLSFTYSKWKKDICSISVHVNWFSYSTSKYLQMLFNFLIADLVKEIPSFSTSHNLLSSSRDYLRLALLVPTLYLTVVSVVRVAGYIWD
mgnify:CR=1 FL=1